VISALVVVLLAIGVAVVLGLIKQADPVLATGPVPVAPVAQPGADTAACRAFMLALPADLGTFRGRAVDGGGPGVAAWGDPPVILRCGLETPEDLTCSSSLIQVNKVSWLVLTASGLDQTTYLAVDRSVRIAVTAPDGTSPDAIGQISDVVAAALPGRPPCHDGVLLPTDTK